MGIEERLICAVEHNPVIYDKTLPEYKSNNARENAWKNVGKEVKTEGIDNLKKRWRTLRDAFIKHYRLSKTFKTGTAGGKKKKWVYYDQMLFLVPYIEFKETVGSYEDDANSQLDESDMDIPQMEEESEIKIEDTERDVEESLEENPNSANSGPAKFSLKQNQDGPVIINNKGNLQQPCLKNKMSKNTLTDEKLLDIVTKNDDPDEQFLLSCLPVLKRLTPRKNMLTRIKMQQLLFDIEFGDGDGDERSTPNCNSRSSSHFSVQLPYILSGPENPGGVVSGTNSGNYVYLNSTPSNTCSV